MQINSSKIIKILYLYDFEGWALYNVGKLWLNDLVNIKVSFIKFKKFRKSSFDEYDLIWFGNYDIFLYHYSSLHINNFNLNKCIVSVHDPIELFSQEEKWKEIKIDLKKWWDISLLRMWIRIQILKKIKIVITTSNEMRYMLQKNNV